MTKFASMNDEAKWICACSNPAVAVLCIISQRVFCIKLADERLHVARLRHAAPVKSPTAL